MRLKIKAKDLKQNWEMRGESIVLGLGATYTSAQKRFASVTKARIEKSLRSEFPVLASLTVQLKER